MSLLGDADGAGGGGVGVVPGAVGEEPPPPPPPHAGSADATTAAKSHVSRRRRPLFAEPNCALMACPPFHAWQPWLPMRCERTWRVRVANLHREQSKLRQRCSDTPRTAASVAWTAQTNEIRTNLAGRNPAGPGDVCPACGRRRRAMQISTIGLDSAKNAFQVPASTDAASTRLRRQLPRDVPPRPSSRPRAEVRVPDAVRARPCGEPASHPAMLGGRSTPRPWPVPGLRSRSPAVRCAPRTRSHSATNIRTFGRSALAKERWRARHCRAAPALTGSVPRRST
jgi:hypothetical protein